MADMQIGDLVVRKSDPSMGGFDVYSMNTDPEQDWEKICFFNTKGAIALKAWIDANFIREIYGREPSGEKVE